MNFLAGYLTGKIISCLENKVKENPFYQKISGNIPILSSNNSELNMLLEKSLKFVKENPIVSALNDEEIIESIDNNIDIISECIVLSRNQIPRDIFLSRIKYINDNEEYRISMEAFYKSLYDQIYDKKNNYPTLQNIQILNSLEEIKNEVTSGFSVNHDEHSKIHSLLLEIKTSLDTDKSKYINELRTIEEKIHMREFNIARELAFNIENKINSGNNREENEQLYILIVNSYLLEGDKQEQSNIYFDKLIFYTDDDKKKNARKILCMVINKDFYNAQKELDKIFQNNEQVEQNIYETQINLFLVSGNYISGENFIKENKDNITNHQYYLSLMLIQQYKFDEVMIFFEEEIDFFSRNQFEIQEISILIRSHFYLKQYKETTKIDLLNELNILLLDIDNILLKIGDSVVKKSYMLSIKAMILAALNNSEKAIIEYENALILDPENHNALKNYPYLLLNKSDKIDKGLELVEKFLVKYPESIDELILFYSLLTIKYPEKTIVKLKNKESIKPEIKIYLIYALDLTNQHTKAETLLKELLITYSDNFSVQFCSGWHYYHLNEKLLAYDYFLKAYELCKNENNYDSVFYYLLLIVCNESGFPKINEVKSILESKYDRSIILIKYPQYYINILLLLNNYEICILCCNELREKGIHRDFIAIAEFTCYYNTRNFQKVRQVLNENRIDYTDDIYIRMAYSCASIGEYELTKDILKKIQKPQKKEKFITISKLMFLVKEYQESLKIIHEAYQIYPDDRDIQECFIKLVYNHHIQPETEEIFNSFGHCLFSYRTSKYENKIIQEITLPKNASGEEILKLIEAQFPKKHDIDARINQINEGYFPISFFQPVFNKTIFSIHRMIINSTYMKIWCTEQFENKWEKIEEKPLYIDLSSLITLELLGLLDYLKKIFPHINITQSTLDMILFFDNELSQPHCNHVIIRHGDQNNYTLNKSEEDIILEMKQKVEKIKNFTLSKNINVIGSILSPKKIYTSKNNGFSNQI